MEWLLGDDPLGPLAVLVDKSLIQAEAGSGGTMYRMLDPIRAYAARRLVDAGEERAARDRHVAWSLYVLQRAHLGPDGRPVTLCGELASQPIGALALVALGFRALSLTPSALGAVKAMLLELDAILAVYARRVAAGEWRDYALEMSRDRAVFSIFRRTTEIPLYRIEKNVRQPRHQGPYSVVAATGLVVKMGRDLRAVLAALDGPRLVVR